MYQRIMVIGCCGGGKSTLAKQIHEKTGLPLIHLDKEYWQPNWKETDQEVWKEKVKEMSEQENWIIDGNYISTMSIRIKKADLVIFVDRNRYICLLQAFKRMINLKQIKRTDMAEGCKEKFDIDFYKFIWEFNKITRPRIIELLESHEHVDVIRIRNKKDSQRLWQCL